jgi:aerobic carbon-monoxide dehydrogenase medium subunit
MKPVAFDVVRPRSVTEVIDLLSRSNGEARIVAGAQSLGPMLNLRLVRPQMLLDITGIPEMSAVEEDEEGVTVGACVTTGSIEDGKLPRNGLAMMPVIAAGIAYRAVRNRGTIGGSVCHADPAADWPSALCGFGAACIIEGTNGRRTIPISEFIVGAFENTLAASEFLVAIRIPRLSKKGRWGYQKLCRKAGEFAMAIGVIKIDPALDIFRMTFGAMEGRQIVVSDFRSLCRGNAVELDERAVSEKLAEHGVTSPIASRQKMTVMQRALRQAMT